MCHRRQEWTYALGWNHGRKVFVRHPTVWHKAVLYRGLRTNRNSCVAGEENSWPRRYSPWGAPQAPSIKHSPVEADKDLGWNGPLRSSVIVKKLFGTNARWASGIKNEREFDFAKPFFYILLWSYHLATIWGTIWQARNVILTIFLQYMIE